MIILKKTYEVKIFSSFRNFTSKNYPPSESAHFTEFPTKPTLDDVTLCDVREKILQKLGMCKILRRFRKWSFFWTAAVQKKIELIFHFFSKFLSCNSAQKIAVLFWVCRGVSLSVCCNQVQSYPWDMRQCRVRSKRRQKKWQTEKRKKCRPDGNWTLASANTVNSLCILGSWVQIPDMEIFFPSFF